MYISKNLRIFLCILLVLALAFTVGCSAVQAPTPTTIRLWHYYNGPQQDSFNALVQEFNETVGMKAGIIVEAYGQGNVTHLNEAVLAAANNNAGSEPMPDIFAAYSDTAYQLDALGVVANLDDYLTPQMLAEYIPGYIEEGRFDREGHLKIFPIAKSTELMVINETYWNTFAEATGSSLEELSTLEGLAATAKRYYEWTDSQTKAPNDGKAFFGRDSMANYMLIGCRQLGVELLAVENGVSTIRIDRKAMRRLWDNFYSPYIHGYFAHYGRFRSDDIKTGDILAQVGSASGAAYFPKQVMQDDNSAHDITMAVMEAPRFKDSLPYAVQQGAGMVVTKSNPVTERACVEFLRWFTQQDQNMRFSLSSGYLPVTSKNSNAAALHSFTTKHPEIDISPNLTAALETALGVTQSHTMYTNKAFYNGTDARNLLESSLINVATTDRKQVQTMLASGMSLEQATAQYLTDSYFELWLDGLEKGLNKAVQ